MVKKNSRVILGVGAVAVAMITGCTSSIPLTSSLNDFVSMGTKANSQQDISFTYSSQIADGIFYPYDKEKQKVVSGHPGYQMTPSSTLERMVREYMGNKFTKLTEGSPTTLSLNFKDFWIEQYSTDNTGKQVLVAFAGGEINMLCIAKVKAELKLIKDGQEQLKVLSATSDANYVQGVGTGTSTSNIYRGQESIEYVHAKNINTAFNKLVMMINAYLEENGL